MEASVLSRLVTDRSVEGIVATLSLLIRQGDIAPGDRLPTVRALAKELGVGVATVSDAWGTLAAAGMVETRGRAGSFVPVLANRTTGGRFFRYSRQGDFRLDLSSGLPDPTLLPSPGRFLAQIEMPAPTSYIADPVVPALEQQVRAALPFDPPSVTVVDGALDALDRLLGMWVRLGDRVAVADPGFPPIFDLVEQHGGIAVPVDIDDEGPVADSLAKALRGRPVAVVLQPRAQNPTGVHLSDARVRELAELLSSTRHTWVIEDDHSGAIASSPLYSLAAALPDRVLHITSFSKSHGPDFRLATVAGPSAAVQEVNDRRLLGPAWSSRFLQSVVAAMLADPECQSQVDSARTIYAARRMKLATALEERGIVTGGTDGINLWVPVRDEQAALVALASRGIAVAPGRPFQLRPSYHGYVRITTGSSPADLTEVAEILVG